MSKGTEFLEIVTGEIEKKLGRLELTIQDVKKDIHAMNEYYWENYTEMDEYGYENYDNQVQLQMQVDANHENRKNRRILEKMLDSPFFGSIRFAFDDEEEEDAETYYIGIANFAVKNGAIPLIYDWRAPICSVFYNYDHGRASYEAPMGVIEGELLEKSQYKIRHGKMLYEFENEVKIDDEILQEELSKAGDDKLKNIIRTIQKEQNLIIRNTKDKILMIQGSAGSGKTSIALHRIAYLLYHDRKNLKSSNILILSPNNVFADYISQILPELGEENIQEMSLDIFAYRELLAYSADCEDRYHHVERMIALEKKSGKKKQTAEKRYRYKQSADYVTDLTEYAKSLEETLMQFHPIAYRKQSWSIEEIRHYFYEIYASTPLLSRMELLYEKFVDDYETLYGSIREEDAELLHETFYAMYRSQDLYVIYSWFLEEMVYPALPHAYHEKRMIPYEDVYPMLYLKYLLIKSRQRKQVRHLVIDEMQDYTYLQYRILNNLFPCSKTILGDKAQTLEEKQQDVMKFLPELLGQDARAIRLTKSYRNTVEIAEYAGQFQNVADIDFFERHGRKVEEVSVSTICEACRDIAERIKKEEQRPETIAVLALTEADARMAYEQLMESGLTDGKTGLYYIDRDSSHFRKGITVTTWYLAKGLEFDQVYVLPVDEQLKISNQYHYIAATRAMHELVVYR